MGITQSSVEENDDISNIKKIKQVRFHLQNQEHVVNVAKCDDITPSTTLNYYLRNILGMKGTKGMCFEGGCGACVVVLQNEDPITQKDVYLAVNSCLVPLLSCNGWRIFTIEGIGNAVDGYHPIQEVLARFNGTQCGFCSPGMVMNMYALYQCGELTMKQVENAFSGNLCRCTGYRPILAAFKSLCTDVSSEILGEYPDIEDFVLCHKEKCSKNETCAQICSTQPFYLELGSATRWVKVHTLRDLLKTLSAPPRANSYRLVAGNTAQGVYPSYKEDVELYIDVSDVAELKVHSVHRDYCVVGANITLTDAIEFFNEVSRSHSNFAYLKACADHIDLVANRPVRNRGTIAGNLMIKHDHREFPSDIFLLLETVEAVLTVVNLSGKETNLSPLEFLNYEFRRPPMVLKTITLKEIGPSTKFISYKIMPRAQNTHAIVNAGFLFKFQNNVIRSANIIYGNINPNFVHASASENFLKGKNVFDNSVLQATFQTLKQEIHPNQNPPDPVPEARKILAINLFYKAILSIAPDTKISDKNKSGAVILQRPVSNGTQDFETKKSMYPVSQPVQKLEALAQTSGEAQYVIDLPEQPSQLYGALLLAKAPPNSTIRHIDAKNALSREDIVAFYSKDDIPGKNAFTILTIVTVSEEQLFASDRIEYYEQPLGILIGKSQHAVDQAVDLITVTYNPPNLEPLLTSRQAVNENRTDRITNYKNITASRKGDNVKKVVKGTFDIYHQYHFHMETHAVQVVPTENGLDVYLGTQWMDFVQIAIARVLNIPQNRINVIVRRCGGSFGSKLVKISLIACAAALAAWKLKKPVMVWLPLTTNMSVIGKRFPLSTDYEVGVDDDGQIQYLDCTHWSDTGHQLVEIVSTWLEKNFMNLYTNDTFTVRFNNVATDTHSSAWTRAPGTVEGVGCIENIMEHISHATGLDPIAVRLKNLSNQTPADKYIADIKVWAEIDKRNAEIATFNKDNRWKKKGLAVSPLIFDISGIGPHLATVSIFHDDGSVQISHGGCEIGQGINTKAAQVCAYKFGIPLEKVQVLPSTSFNSPNNIATGGSFASDGVCYAVAQACDTLLERMKPYRTDGAKWEDVVTQSHTNFIKLIETGKYSSTQPDVQPYLIYGVCATEVEVDILTGQHIVTRIDLIEDVGDSISPNIDIGQAEGALIFGLGYYTMEKIVFNYEGRILTNNTWTYHVPGVKDIPVQFNVKFPKNNPNPVGVLRSKGTGEPATVSGITLALAIRRAVASARRDAEASSDSWYKIDGTTDVENVLLNCLNDSTQFVL